MNGKLRMPLTYTPTSNPPESTVYIWIDENGKMKSMDNSGEVTDYLINGELRTKSPNGTVWALKVDDSGNFTTEAV